MFTISAYGATSLVRTVEMQQHVKLTQAVPDIGKVRSSLTCCRLVLIKFNLYYSRKIKQ